jgi:hypothetical protein
MQKWLSEHLESDDLLEHNDTLSPSQSLYHYDVHTAFCSPFKGTGFTMVIDMM